ncbi:hypothetical protein N7452_000367 [Penicillium brevicompactum]|uniref:DUF4211 domain-containing protein n=1 Tax=Penicillium brevicompactum TaxID=5074 RepID=A0A9W9R0B2_PENBR|nr:hypothetical protein N7452_000367 [Penicillium brevicompactum]
MPRAKKFQRALRFAPKGAADTDPEEPTKPRRAPKRKATSPIIVSDDDEPVVASARKRTKPAQLARTSPSLSSEDENEIVAPSTARKRRTRNPIDVKESDDSDQPVASSPMKRLRRGPEIDNAQLPHTPRHTSKQSKLDIEEDLVDLQDSVVKDTRTRGRNVESARDKRLKQLEVLRRRRAGLKEQSEDDAEEDAEGTSGSDIEEVMNRASPSGQGLWKHHDENSDVESTIDPNEDLDRYEDDFVLEDDKDDLGVPTEEIPFEFTRHAYKQPKEYFRDVIGWMVHNKLNPAFPRSDAMYEMAFMKLEDEVKGRAGSQLISSVWTPGFVYSLQARPHMDVSAYPTEENHSCDACRRSGHPASADMRLFGKPYSLQTLEPLNDDDDSDSNDDSNKSTNDGNDRDRNGHVIPDEHVHFYLGKQCKSRAVLAHTLTHWRHHLNEWVIDHLDRIGLMDDDEVLKRNNLSIKRRTRHANQVLDRMVFTGEVDKLWRDFHLNLKSAREKESIYG